MATYYVDPVNGSDTNNGLGPDASHASNRPFATIGKLIAASGALSSDGDVAYLAPGHYRESVTVGITSPTAERRIVGDPLNAQGFRTAGGVAVAPGLVVWSGGTQQLYATASTHALILSGRDYLTFENICLIGSATGNGQIVDAVTSTSTNITFTNCAFHSHLYGTQAGIAIASAADVALNWTLDRCLVVTPHLTTGFLFITATRPSATDFDLNVLVKNCVFLSGGRAVGIQTTGANSGKPGGVRVHKCTYLGAGPLLQTVTASTISTTTNYQCEAFDSLIMSAGTALNAATSGQILEKRCVIIAATSRSNVTANNNSYSDGSRAPLLDAGFAQMLGFMAQSPWVPSQLSAVLGMGGDASITTDMLNRPRPAGMANTNSETTSGTATSGASTTLTDTGKSWATNAYRGQDVTITSGTGSGQVRRIVSNTATALTIGSTWATNPDATSVYTVDNPGAQSALGACERHQTAVQETSVIDASGSGIKIIGPGDHDIYVPVNAESTTISVKARYDSAHGTTSKPQAILLASGKLGVATETKTMTSAADTWETLTFSAVTPSAKGVVTIRLISRAAAGNGIAYFDTFAVT